MPSHYLYEDPDKGCLCQGDILSRTSELNVLLKDVHPHYAEHSSYNYFIVLTQTCDLVRRGNKPPNSKYITIASVRPVEEAIKREAKKYQDWWQEPNNIIDSKNFNQMILFTESLIDNNNSQYFYLHEDISLGLSGRNCAFLALSISLKIDHYDLCCTAKIAQMQDSFRAKLGWLVGNMYSRVGTKEWNDFYGKDDSRREASFLLKGIFISIDANRIDKAVSELQEIKKLTDYSPDEIYSHVDKVRLISKSKRFNDRVYELLNEEKIIEKISSTLRGNVGNDQSLLQSIQKIIEKNNKETQSSTSANEIIVILKQYLSDFLTDNNFTNYDRFIRKLGASLSQDTIIKNILS